MRGLCTTVCLLTLLGGGLAGTDSLCRHLSAWSAQAGAGPASLGIRTHSGSPPGMQEEEEETQPDPSQGQDRPGPPPTDPKPDSTSPQTPPPKDPVPASQRQPDAQPQPDRPAVVPQQPPGEEPETKPQDDRRPDQSKAADERATPRLQGEKSAQPQPTAENTGSQPEMGGALAAGTAPPTDAAKPDVHPGEPSSQEGGEQVGDQEAVPGEALARPTDPVGTQAAAAGQQPPSHQPLISEIRQEVTRELAEFGRIFSLRRIIPTIIILIIAFLAVKLLTFLLDRISRRRTEYAPWLRRVIPFAGFTVWFLALTSIAAIFAQSLIAVIILVAGVVLALGVASQQILRDIVGGIVIMLERPFQIGDRIRIGEFYGEVTRIGLRSFQVHATDGSMVVIPNSDVMRQAISNANPGSRETLVTAEFPLPPGFDIAVAKRVAYEAAVVSPYVYANRPIDVQVDEIADGQSFTKLIVKAYVFDAPYESQLRSHVIELVKQGLQDSSSGPQGISR